MRIDRSARRGHLGPAAVAVAALSVLAACSGGPTATSTRPAATAPRRAAATSSSYISAGSRLPVGGCPVFPRDHAFHADVRSLPVAPTDAASRAQAGGAATTVRLGFGSGVYQGSRPGIPVNVVDRTTATPTDFAVNALYVDQATPTDVPLPPQPRFEGWPGRAWDRHLLLVDPASCRSTELINVQFPGENLSAPGSWYADSVVGVDLRSNEVPRAAVTASGTSLLAGMVRFDEVASGDVGHAVGMTLPMIRNTAVWPASRSDGRSKDPAAPPMGTWFRLRADADLSGLGPQARVVARALQVHGGVLVDTGPGLTLLGEPDTRWDDQDLAGLTGLDLGDFEVVDPTAMRADATTLRIR